MTTTTDRRLWSIRGIMQIIDEVSQAIEERESENQQELRICDERDRDDLMAYGEDLFGAKVSLDDAWKQLSKWRESYE